MAEIRNTTAAVRANKQQGSIMTFLKRFVYLINICYFHKVKCNWVFWVFNYIYLSRPRTTYAITRCVIALVVSVYFNYKDLGGQKATH